MANFRNHFDFFFVSLVEWFNFWEVLGQNFLLVDLQVDWSFSELFF